jgi:D-sedoheptulose 7-phosphate isomerase
LAKWKVGKSLKISFDQDHHAGEQVKSLRKEELRYLIRNSLILSFLLARLHMIQKRFTEHIDIIQKMMNDPETVPTVQRLINVMTKTFKNGGRVFFCGNGGSAADAQHLAAELSGRFYLERKALNAEALHVNSSFITAIGNDYGFDKIFSRQLEAKAAAGDLLIAISTSGNSANIIECVKTAKKMDLTVVGWSGSTKNILETHCDYMIRVPSADTPRIQEAHILLGHIICEQVEKNLFS